MFTKPSAETQTDVALARALSALDEHNVNSDEYAKIMDQVVKLHAMKEKEKPSRVSPDTLALIAANLTGMLLVVNHEHAHVITTKALNLVQKTR